MTVLISPFNQLSGEISKCFNKLVALSQCRFSLYISSPLQLTVHADLWWISLREKCNATYSTGINLLFDSGELTCIHCNDASKAKVLHLLFIFLRQLVKEKEEGGVVIWKQREVQSVWYMRINVSGTHLSWEIDHYYRRIVWGRCLISQFCPCGRYHSQGPDSWEVWPHSLPSLTLWCYPMWYKDWNETERQMPNLTNCFYDRYHSHRPGCRERSLCNHIVCHTLWAPLSGTLLQTLPDLVMPSGFSYAMKGHSFYLRAAVHQRGQCPPKGSGTNMTVEAA